MTTVEEGLLFVVLSGDFVLALSLLFTEGSRFWSDFISIFTELEHVQVTHFIRFISVHQHWSFIWDSFTQFLCCSVVICYLLSEAQSRCESLAVHNIWRWGNTFVSVVRSTVYWFIWSHSPINCCIWSDGWCVWAPERIPAWTWTKLAIVSTSVCETPTSDIYAHVRMYVHTVCTGGTLCVWCV